MVGCRHLQARLDFGREQWPCLRPSSHWRWGGGRNRYLIRPTPTGPPGAKRPQSILDSAAAADLELTAAELTALNQD
jgi:hypothetical protein